MAKRDRTRALRAWDDTAQKRHRPDRPAPPPSSDERRVQINAQVPVSLRNRFKAKAAAEGVTMSDLVVGWVEDYLGD